MTHIAETFLHNLTYDSKFEVLEEGSYSSELIEIASNRGIVLPAHDLAVFKCTYGFTERFNLNGCRLPHEEVASALNTLAGKAVDYDHFRKNVVGYWLEAKLEGNDIIAYGIFFKGNFGEDYVQIKELMDKGTLAVSFEAYGNKEILSEGKYNLRDIEFSGGALLLKTTPAFPGSEVHEMANKRVLEFAKVMTAPKDFITSKEEKDEGDNSMGEKKKLEKSKDITVDDLKGDLKRSVKCTSCGLSFKTAELAKSTKCTSCGSSVELISDKGSEGGEQMEEKIKELEAEIASLKEQLVSKSTEVETATEVITTLKKESEEASTKIEEMEKDVTIKIEKAKEEAKLISERKAVVAEFANDMSDEDILDDTKFELAKANKKNSELEKALEEAKAGKEEVKGKKEEKSLEAGSEKKEEVKADPVFEAQARVDALAWK